MNKNKNLFRNILILNTILYISAYLIHYFGKRKMGMMRTLVYVNSILEKYNTSIILILMIIVSLVSIIMVIVKSLKKYDYIWTINTIVNTYFIGYTVFADRDYIYSSVALIFGIISIIQSFGSLVVLKKYGDAGYEK